MPVTPTGTLSLMLSRTRQIIAGSGTFQDVVEADDEAEALLSVFYHSVEDEDTARPYAIVRLMNDEDGQQISNTGYQFDGMILVEFHFDIPAEYIGNYSDSYLWFTNQIGAIISEITVLTRTGNVTNNYIAFHAISQGPLGLVDPVEHGNKHFGVSSWVMTVRSRP